MIDDIVETEAKAKGFKIAILTTIYFRRRETMSKNSIVIIDDFVAISISMNMK